MNPEQLHDAITQLPCDLIAQSDQLRRAPRRRPLRLRHWAPLAACFTVLLCLGLVLRYGLPAEKTADSVAEAPAAAAPLAPEEEARPETAANAASQEEPYEDVCDGAGIVQDVPAGEHRHSYAEAEEAPKGTVSGYCGNTQVTVYLGEGIHTLTGGDAAALTEILENLPYDPELVCGCPGAFTVDTGRISRIQVNLSLGFARCDAGQASLTQAQAQTIQAILEGLV